MGSVGLLILFAAAGAFICAKVRAAGGVALFVGLAIVLFISTPVGQSVPGAVSTFMSSLDHAATPALNGTQQAETSGDGS